MASKEEQRAADEAAALAAFLSIGLDEANAKNATTNLKFRRNLLDIIAEAGVPTEGVPKAKGNLLYYLAGKYPVNALVHRPVVLKHIMDEGIKFNAQLDGAFEYLRKVGSTALDEAQLKDAAGVGVVVTPEQVAETVTAVLKEAAAQVQEERYRCVNVLLGRVRAVHKWADGAVARAEMEKQLEAVLGPKTEEDLKPIDKKKIKAAKAESAAAAAAAAPPSSARTAANTATPTPAAPVPEPPADPYAFLPKPQENNDVHTTINFSDGRVMRIANTLEQLAAHFKETGGKVVTRFPPEPNGYLHIGHAKAMFVDFGMARQYDGVCYLRYDDTNPAAEKLEYIQHIEEIVGWMGWQPWKVTYSSDYFQQLYDFAVQLIKAGHAYVCHQTKDEIEASRKELAPSPWRDRPVAENLKLFDDMRRGLIDEGKATLRLKMDYRNDNYNMFDLVAYRIKFMAHPHAGDGWCVYPSYDYTHCIVDALENITHSLCTLEFESRRASYYWLLEVLGIYKPRVWEYSRLNITHTVMSKRKLNKLVTGGYVNGWDDPRLLTLAGLRRRGVTSEAINAFCREIGVTRADNLIHMHRLEHHIRSHLDETSPRTLAVLRPLKLVVSNLPADYFQEVEAKVFPGRSEEGYKVPLTRVVYIESTDFRELDSKDYYGLAPGKSVMLRYAFPVKYVSHAKDAGGTVTEVVVEADLAPAGKKPPKGVLNWVAQPAPGTEPQRFEARIYDHLFKSEVPEESGDDWLADLNDQSLQVLSGCMAVPSLTAAKPGDRFQFERLGYFCADPDSRPGALVFNRTVTLKESFPKQAPPKQRA